MLLTLFLDRWTRADSRDCRSQRTKRSQGVSITPFDFMSALLTVYTVQCSSGIVLELPCDQVFRSGNGRSQETEEAYQEQENEHPSFQQLIDAQESCHGKD